MNIETWTDPKTGLEWQVEPASKVMTWADAMKYASDLKLAGGNWRLPTKEKLLTVSGKKRPKELKGEGYFWSSSAVADYDGYRWRVHFGYGHVDYVYVNNDYYVRCVRNVKEKQ